MTRVAALLALVPSLALAQPGGVALIFTPESDRFVEATRQYQDIWSREGGRIVEGLEAVSGLRFREPVPVPVTVYEGISFAGIKNPRMMMRASLRPSLKLGTLVHELGHRLIRQVRKRPADADEHRVLNLILYDTWVKLYGRAFADEMVTHESGLRKEYDYLLAWRWALEMTPEQRAARFRAIVAEGMPQ